MDTRRAELLLCTGCLELRHPAQFLDGGSQCSVCRGIREPSVRAISAKEEGEEVAEMQYGPKHQKRACVKCGRIGWPGPIALHERACGGTGTPRGGDAEKRRHGEAETAATTVAVRTRRAPVVRVTPAPADGVSVSDVVDQIRQRIADCETALRVIAELAAGR